MKPVKTILIVDDDLMVNMVTERLLLRHNKDYKIVTFTNPVKALESLKEKYSNHESLPDIVLLDIRMPELTGFEFLDKLKESELFDSLQVIMYTSSAAVADQEKSQVYKNVIGYMQKPFSVNLFNEILDKIFI
jgi:two-component system, CitB family, response regulator MalR